MKARSYLGRSQLVLCTLVGVAALTAGADAAMADPKAPNLAREFQASAKAPKTDFVFRGRGAIEPPYQDANGSFVTIESLVEPTPPVDVPVLSLDRPKSAQEVATPARSAKRAVGWAFAPLGLFLGGLGVAASIGEFDPGRTRTTATGTKAPNDMGARAAAGTTFLALGIPMVCVGVWALLSPDTTRRDSRGYFVARDTIPITRGLGLSPQGLVF